MTSENITTLKLKVENFRFYQGGGVLYLIARTTDHHIANNKIIVERNQLCKLSFNTDIENFSSKKIFDNKIISFEVFEEYEECTINGSNAIVLKPKKISGYEDNKRDVN